MLHTLWRKHQPPSSSFLLCNSMRGFKSHPCHVLFLPPTTRNARACSTHHHNTPASIISHPLRIPNQTTRECGCVGSHDSLTLASKTVLVDANAMQCRSDKAHRCTGDPTHRTHLSGCLGVSLCLASLPRRTADRKKTRLTRKVERASAQRDRIVCPFDGRPLPSVPHPFPPPPLPSSSPLSSPARRGGRAAISSST